MLTGSICLYMKFHNRWTVDTITFTASHVLVIFLVTGCDWVNIGIFGQDFGLQLALNEYEYAMYLRHQFTHQLDSFNLSGFELSNLSIHLYNLFSDKLPVSWRMSVVSRRRSFRVWDIQLSISWRYPFDQCCKHGCPCFSVVAMCKFPSFPIY